MRPVLLFATLSILATVATGQTFIEPGTFGDSSWRGPLATEAALGACDADSAEWAHWIESYDGGGGAIARCPADGSDWEFYEFGGGGGGSGTVTSVAMSAPTGFTISGSPITTSGTFTLGLSTQTANTVWAGPTTGSAATPAFRALVEADIPDLSGTYLTGITAHASTHAHSGGDQLTLESLFTECDTGEGISAGAGNTVVCDLTDYATQAELDALDTTADDLSDNSITDLSDVTAMSGNTSTVATTSGTLTSGDCVEFDASGNLVASGGACGGGSPTFADIASGTNTTAAMVVGTGASLATTGSGTIAATSILNTASGGWGLAPDATFPANIFRIYGTSGNRQFHFGAATGAAQIEINVAGTSRNGVYVQGGAWIAKTTPTATTPNLVPNAASDPDTGLGWDATTGGISIIDESTSLLLATTTGDDYVSIRGCKHFGAMAAAPAVTTPSECDQYTDTDDGSGNAAQCVYLDGAWAKMVGAGTCS